MLVASVARPRTTCSRRARGQIDRTVEDATFGPVRAHITGTPTLDRAIKDESLDSTSALVIAIPLLFVALLLILRAPFAAATTGLPAPSRPSPGSAS